jgi:hypothetical protein
MCSVCNYVNFPNSRAILGHGLIYQELNKQQYSFNSKCYKQQKRRQNDDDDDE